jgi:outer membrane receptor protein involved in Fe transport
MRLLPSNRALVSSGSALALAFSLASPAFAQPAQPTQRTPGQNQPPSPTQPADAPEELDTEVELESGQATDANDNDQSIIVTGSRIRRPGLESVVPVTSVNTQELTQRGEVSLGDALNDLPALRSTFSQANSTTSIGTAGLSLLDLRGLGTVRTLVLVNGRRHVTAQPGNYNVDVNTIPVDLLERVDVVTGGNSAIYGSDAVAGVVNFVLRRDFEGIRIRGQSGISTYGDRSNQFVSAIVGRNFFDNRLNIALHAEYSNSEEVFFSDRRYLGAYTGPSGFITSEPTNAVNRNFNGIPNTVFFDNRGGTRAGSMFGNISLGGYVAPGCTLLRPDQIAALTPAQRATYDSPTQVARRAAACTGAQGPAPIGQPAGNGAFISRNYAFDESGNLLADIPDTDNRTIGGGVFGGRSATGLEDAMLLPGLERMTGNLLINAEISPALQPFLEAKFVRVNATQQNTQPTFIQSTLPGTFAIDNPFLTAQARAQLQTLFPGQTTFSILRFNNDFGNRAEQHRRDTYRVVAGIRGDLSQTGNLRYELALNYGRTETYYETGGNVHLQRFRNAVNAVRPTTGPNAGQIVCGINADATTANDDPACVPLNVFGFGAPSQASLNYIRHTSVRNEWAEQINAVGFVSGDSTGIFELPGGPVGFAVGAEYRREDAASVYDLTTQRGETFLNAFQPFQPPALEIRDVFGELRLPLLRDLPFIREFTLEGAARYSDYSTFGGVWAYNVGAFYSPVQGVRFRAGYARSVRAPNLSNLFAAATQTFQNAFTDPCDQPGGTNASNNIAADPNRAKNCAAAGVPTTITYTDANGVTRTEPFRNNPGSGIVGINSGNPDLVPEVGRSFTVGAILQPPFLPGFSLTIDYYNITVENVISGLTGQAIINRCYDDPTGLNNEFCAAINRRTSATDPFLNGTFAGQSSRRLPGITQDIPLPVTGNSFINQPYNFAALEREGVDFDMAYRTRLGANTTLNLRGIVSYLIRSENYTYLTQPNRSDRIHGTFGDPQWAATFNANLDMGEIDLTYSANFVGRQTILSYETQFTHQGRGPTNPDARPFTHYPDIVYHNFRIGFEPGERFSFYTGVDNVLNQLPPFDLTGIEGGSPFSPVGRYFYAGAQVRF